MVKPGYKQTEIGIFPEDWDVLTMDKLTTLMTNGFVGTIKCEYVPSGTGILYLQGFNVKENRFDLTGVTYVSKEFHQKHLKSELKENDLLTVQTGNIGVTAVVPKEYQGANCQALIISRFHACYDSRYWSYYFNSVGRKSLIEIETGSTMKHINVGDLKNVYVPVPATKTEQGAIAAALSDIDALIANLEKLIAKKKAIKQGTMQELLTGKRRLPGFGGAWENVRLGDHCVVLRGGSPRPIQAYLTSSPQGANWIKIGDVREGDKYITATAERIIEAGISRSREVFAGDFILSNSMSFGRPYILKINGCIHDGWLVIQNYQESFDQQYLYYVLGSDFVKSQYIAMAAGSSVQNLNKEKVSNVVLYKPTVEEQQSIAAILSDMDEEILDCENKLAKYRGIKQGMMSELLTGRIRLIDKEDA